MVPGDHASPDMPRLGGVATLVAIGLLVAAAVPAAFADAVQPVQPKHGPGGSNYRHGDWRVSSGGNGSAAWYVFEPIDPQPARAPVAIVMHGYGEFAGYDTMYGLIRHTVRKGNVVIYPRWQTSLFEPCPGPFDIEPCIASSVSGIHGALAYLKADRDRVQPDLRRASYFGFSFGGIITANLANRHRVLGLPVPRAIFLDDPHDGALAGLGEPALDDSLAGIPRKALIQCDASAEGVLSEPDQGGVLGSCNAVFPKLGHISRRNKDLVLVHTDAHGTPALSSDHGVCTGGAGYVAADAYDWNFCWKIFDAMRDCAYSRKHCAYALGKRRKHRFLGRWSDGVPVIPLKVQDEAPITP
jgi:pimeloyl-ACP methyl ester carboxylesterase